MAVLNKETEWILIGGIIIAAVVIYKRFKPGIDAAHAAAVNATADYLANDIMGYDDKQAELDKPAPGKDTPEYAALIEASNAWHTGGKVSEKTWRLALNYNPTNPVMLRAGKAWNYGWPWDYWGKDY